jgi:sugar lactone lactonase YvrE
MKNVLLPILLFIIPLLGFSQTPEYRIDKVLGVPINIPQDIALDEAGNIFIADSYGVMKLNKDGVYQKAFSAGYLGSAWGIALDHTGNIYVLNLSHSAIQKYDANGTLLSTFYPSPNKDYISEYASGIAVDKDGNMYVASDTGAQKLDAEGKWVRNFGSEGPEEHRLVRPVDIDVDAAGNVYVSDNVLHCIKKYNAAGVFIKKFSFDLWQREQSSSPQSIAIDAAGNIIVADVDNYSIEKFNPEGELLVTSEVQGYGDGYGMCLLMIIGALPLTRMEICT